MVTLRTHDIMICGGMNGKLLQKMYFLKNAKKTCKSNNRDLNRDRIMENFLFLDSGLAKVQLLYFLSR